MKKVAAFLFLFSTSTAFAADAGMFLCPSPVIANGFWSDIVDAQKMGLQVNKDIASRIATKNRCSFISGDSLKPINFVAGQLEITDGYLKGWSSPFQYIYYVNRQQP